MSRKRKVHSEAFKAKVALEAIKEARTLGELAAAYGVHPAVIAGWKRQLRARAPELFARGADRPGRTEDEIAAPLYQEIGRLKMEVDWLKKKL